MKDMPTTIDFRRDYLKYEGAMWKRDLKETMDMRKFLEGKINKDLHQQAQFFKSSRSKPKMSTLNI